jgi:hypothetical protein
MQILKLVLIAILLSVFFIIFPLFLHVKIYKITNKTLIELKLFKILTLIKGEIRIKGDKILLDFGGRRIKIFSIDTLINKENIKNLLDINVLSVNLELNIGHKEFEILFGLTCFTSIMLDIIFNVLKSKKQYILLNKNINLYTYKNTLNYKVEVLFVLNFVSILIIVIKKFLGKLRNERKQNQSNVVGDFKKYN